MPNIDAVALQDDIVSINPDNVPVVSQLRLDRRELAPLVRKLFKTLGLKGISVTLSSYSMARTVQIRIPRPIVRGEDYLDSAGKSYTDVSFIDMPDDVPAKLRNRRDFYVKSCMLDILDQAFPGCRDRSDYKTDYFDYKFSIE